MQPLRAMSRQFLEDGIALRTDDDDALKKAANAFGVTYAVALNDDGEREVGHTPNVYVVDESGSNHSHVAFRRPVDRHDERSQHLARPHAMTARRGTVVRRLVAAAALLVALTGCSDGDSGFGVNDAEVSAVADYDFSIPEGAGLALDAGTPLNILPARLDARVGQTIQIVNNDDRGHLVGPWFVGANETMRQTFASPGEFIGECTVHPSGEIRVIISA